MSKKVNSKISTVMFIDLVNYTETTAALSRQSVDQLHEVFDSLALPLFAEYQGQVIKKIGDAFLVTFESPTNALLCGEHMQKEFAAYNQQHKLKKPLRVRVAVHTGEIVMRRNDIYGDTVNTASRIESITKPGHVVFSESVYNAINKNEVKYRHLGLKRLKGIKRPIRLFLLSIRHDRRVRRRYELWQQVKKKLLFVFLLVACVILLYYVFVHLLVLL